MSKPALLHRVRLNVELTNGNDGRGSKWFSSAKVRDSIEEVLRSDGHTRNPFAVPVVVRMTRILGKNQRLWDADSGLRGNAKEIMDALVVLGWFHDDGPKYITEVQFRQLAPDPRTTPSLIVEVFESQPEMATA